MRFQPHRYQTCAIERILSQKAVGLFLSMGLGKTVVTLTAIDRLLNEEFAVARVLVIAPLQVARTVWQAEAAKWDHLRHLRVSLVLGTEAQRLQALAQTADVYVVNRENVAWLVERYRRDWPFDMVVVDELSSFKSARSARFRALRRVRPGVTRIVGLTGTPAPNGLLDLWAQAYLLDQGQRLGTTMGGYRQRFFDEGKRNAHVVFQWVPKPGAAERIYALLSDLCVSMRSEDYLELPERLDRYVAVPLDPAARSAYETMAREAVLPLLEGTVTATTAATVTGKLLQMANGAVYGEDGAVHAIHDAKLLMLQELVEAANGQPVLVYYAYRHDLARIRETLKAFAPTVLSEGDVRDTVNAWNAGQIPLLLAHPDNAGHGLNLQAGGNIVIWFGLTWSLEKYQQANARLHRQGQERPVVIYHLIAEGTVDEDVIRVLSGKEAGQDALMEAVKARVAGTR